ncbi:MAG: hypothetical protein II670_09955, partial [Alphaproteobacteria bacterium]|nr:hypothetical protein [Alphaproteobacteria bacterium]
EVPQVEHHVVLSHNAIPVVNQRFVHLLPESKGRLVYLMTFAWKKCVSLVKNTFFPFNTILEMKLVTFIFCSSSCAI